MHYMASILYQTEEATPSFSLIANRFLSEEYSPKSVSIKTGVAAETIIRIADELAKTAFEKERRIEQEWTDWKVFNTASS